MFSFICSYCNVITDLMYVAAFLDPSVNCRTCFSTPSEAYIFGGKPQYRLRTTYDFARGLACFNTESSEDGSAKLWSLGRYTAFLDN